MSPILVTGRRRKNTAASHCIYPAAKTISFYKLNSPDFKDMLAENHVDVTWVSLPGYTHEWRFWNLQVEQFLDWIPRTDGYATQENEKSDSVKICFCDLTCSLKAGPHSPGAPAF